MMELVGMCVGKWELGNWLVVDGVLQCDYEQCYECGDQVVDYDVEFVFQVVVEVVDWWWFEYVEEVECDECLQLIDEGCGCDEQYYELDCDDFVLDDGVWIGYVGFFCGEIGDLCVGYEVDGDQYLLFGYCQVVVEYDECELVEQ